MASGTTRPWVHCRTAFRGNRCACQRWTSRAMSKIAALALLAGYAWVPAVKDAVVPAACDSRWAAGDMLRDNFRYRATSLPWQDVTCANADAPTGFVSRLSGNCGHAAGTGRPRRPTAPSACPPHRRLPHRPGEREQAAQHDPRVPRRPDRVRRLPRRPDRGAVRGASPGVPRRDRRADPSHPQAQARRRRVILQVGRPARAPGRQPDGPHRHH
jgi:hypothetical protein